jgi:hypothetical protein
MLGSTQSYGLADGLLSQAAMMVMAVSSNSQLGVDTVYIALCRLSTNQAQMESRSERLPPIFFLDSLAAPT